MLLKKDQLIRCQDVFKMLIFSGDIINFEMLPPKDLLITSSLIIWTNGLMVNALDFQSRGPAFKRSREVLFDS